MKTKASKSSTPASRQAATIRRPSAAVTARGFSQNTCLPARAAARVHSAWSELGSEM